MKYVQKWMELQKTTQRELTQTREVNEQGELKLGSSTCIALERENS